MSDSRIKKSMKNTIFGLVGMISMLIISFISKTIFIKILGDALNGVNYLFTGILNALNLAELGFAGAVAFALYKPLSTGDEETISALMNLFKKFYRIVAIIVTVVGLLCIPVLPYLIKEDFSTLPFTLKELKIYYSMFLANTVLSYLLAYKRTIITADQDAYIVTTVDYACNIALNIVQIILLILTKNYYWFLSIMLVKTVINNVILMLIANKRYPYLKTYKNVKLVDEEKKKLYANVRAMMLHKFGTVIILNTSTIVVSALVGVVENGLYGNYMMIANQGMAFVNIIFTSITASAGNLCAEADLEKQIKIFNNMNYISLWIGYFAFVCLICLFNPFIDIWLGEGKTFGMITVFMITANQFVSYLRKSVQTFKDAKGIFREDRFKPLIEAVVGISLAIGLGYVWGIFGILLGYTLATVLIAMPIEKWALFNKGLGISPNKYMLKDILIFAASVLMSYLMYLLCNLMGDGFAWFIVKALTCLIIPNVVFILFTFKTDEFKYFFNIFTTTITRLKEKLFHKEKKASQE